MLPAACLEKTDLPLYRLLYLHNQHPTELHLHTRVSPYLSRNRMFCLRKVVWERGQTLIELFWVFGLNSGECAHKSFVQCFNQLCWVSSKKGERKTLTKTPEYILHSSGERNAINGKWCTHRRQAPDLQSNHVILKHYIQDFPFAMLRKWSQDALLFKVPNLFLSLFVLLSWTSPGLAIINVPVMFPDISALFSSVVEHK